MSKKNILIVCASNGKNLELANQVLSSLQEYDVQADILDLVDLDLPLYSPVSQKLGVPEPLKEEMIRLKSTQAFVFISPEYNGCIPPTLNNFIAWVSVVSDDFRACFGGKSAAIMSFSGAGSNILPVMRLQLAYLGLNVVGRQLLANASRPPKPESIDSIVEELLKIS